MRTGNIEINGVTYPLCFSASILVALEEQGQDISDVLGADKLAVSNLLKLLASMIEAGIKYQRLTGTCDVEPLTYEDVCLLLGPEDFQRVLKAVTETITAGQKRTVEAVEPKDRKNAKATQG